MKIIRQTGLSKNIRWPSLKVAWICHMDRSIKSSSYLKTYRTELTKYKKSKISLSPKITTNQTLHN